jgi:hypothetical protein
VRSFTAVVARDTETGLLVGHIPGFRDAHSQAATMEELDAIWLKSSPCCWRTVNPRLEADLQSNGPPTLN